MTKPQCYECQANWPYNCEAHTTMAKRQTSRSLESSTPITDMMNGIGLPPDRLRKALDGNDNWGKMIHAFEYLAACGLLLQLADNESKET